MAFSVGLIGGLVYVLIPFIMSGQSGVLSEGLIGGLIMFAGVGLSCWSESRLKNGVMSGLICGLVGGVFYWSERAALDGVLYGLSVGLIGGLIGGLGAVSLNQITLVETISWNWNQFWKRMIPGCIVGLIVSISIVEFFKAFFGSIGSIGTAAADNPRTLALFSGFSHTLVIYCLSVGLIFGLIGGLVSGLVGGFTDRVKVVKASPNQGIRLSLKNSLTSSLVTWLIAGLSVGLTAGLAFGSNDRLSYGLIAGASAGLIVALIVGLNRGGSTVIKHYALRLNLWLKGYTPFHFVKFLDQCARLILLKKVGGGYIFIHRMLLEYFAELRPSRTEDRI
jgi:hypothetical protein